MDNQSKTPNKDSHIINPEKALGLFVDKFLELHPRESWPKWFTSHTNLAEISTEKSRISTGGSNKRKFAIVALQKREPGPDQWYEEFDGEEVLATYFPGTQEKGYIINMPEPEILIIFGAVVNLENSALTILVNKDLFSINGEKLLKLR